mmetsp:Transcript_10615/g.43442  ORF Transcript_10615/g.43442 Transcript_10615/m.43442 type:complete len:746 (-) Transcript_10615:2537-4774(-)
MLCGQFDRPFKKQLADHREKFCRVRRRIGVDQAAAALVLARQLPPQRVELVAHHRRPAPVGLGRRQGRRAVGRPSCLIELVRELVDDHVVPVPWRGRAALHLVPGQQHLALAPAFAGQHAALVGQHTAGFGHRTLDDEGAGVEQHLAQLGVEAAGRAEQGQAGQRRDRDPHLVGHAQTAAANDRLLGQEDLHQALQAQLVARRQPSHQGHMAAQQPPPGRREGQAGDARAPAAHPQGPQRHRGGGEQGHEKADQQGHGQLDGFARQLGLAGRLASPADACRRAARVTGGHVQAARALVSAPGLAGAAGRRLCAGADHRPGTFRLHPAVAADAAPGRAGRGRWRSARGHQLRRLYERCAAGGLDREPGVAPAPLQRRAAAGTADHGLDGLERQLHGLGRVALSRRPVRCGRHAARVGPGPGLADARRAAPGAGPVLHRLGPGHCRVRTGGDGHDRARSRLGLAMAGLRLDRPVLSAAGLALAPAGAARGAEVLRRRLVKSALDVAAANGLLLRRLGLRHQCDLHGRDCREAAAAGRPRPLGLAAGRPGRGTGGVCLGPRRAAHWRCRRAPDRVRPADHRRAAAGAAWRPGGGPARRAAVRGDVHRHRQPHACSGGPALTGQPRQGDGLADAELRRRADQRTGADRADGRAQRRLPSSAVADSARAGVRHALPDGTAEACPAGRRLTQRFWRPSEALVRRGFSKSLTASLSAARCASDRQSFFGMLVPVGVSSTQVVSLVLASATCV